MADLKPHEMRKIIQHHAKMHKFHAAQAAKFKPALSRSKPGTANHRALRKAFKLHSRLARVHGRTHAALKSKMNVNMPNRRAKVGKVHHLLGRLYHRLAKYAHSRPLIGGPKHAAQLKSFGDHFHASSNHLGRRTANRRL